MVQWFSRVTYAIEYDAKYQWLTAVSLYVRTLVMFQVISVILVQRNSGQQCIMIMNKNILTVSVCSG